MAAIDELLLQVSDEALRAQIAAEVAALRKGKRFGLVFEQHLPEVVDLPGLPIRPGVRVHRKSDINGPAHWVVGVTSDAAEIRLEAPNGRPDPEAPLVTVASDSLVVTKRVGEPMYPTLVERDAIWRSPERPAHVVINADNFHALQVLLYGYERRVDVIYIDPPYNTGARDWKYNNNYVDKADSYRHSKWLSMMQRRLVLAKRLLRADGVLIVTIDEHEVGHLSVLLEMVFPDYLRHMVTVVINPKGTGKLNFARVDEYAFFCVPNSGKSMITGVPTYDASATAPGDGALFVSADTARVSAAPQGQDDADTEDEDDEPDDEDTDEQDNAEEEQGADAQSTQALPFPPEEEHEWELRHARRRGGESSYRHQRQNQFYPIFVDEQAGRVVRAGESPPLERNPSHRKVDGLKPVWPIDKEGNERCWRFVPARMQERIDAGLVRLGRYNQKQKSWTINYWVRRTPSKKLKTVWWKRAHDAGTHGTTLLHHILGRRAAFPFPKSVYAVADALAAVVRTRPDAIVLDFFAGSGTTMHATCLLNEVFGGNRRSIMVTNNEVSQKDARRLTRLGVIPGSEPFEAHGICESVTWPRCKSVLTGRRPDGQELPGTYLHGPPMSRGFEENCVYYTLDFLDPSDVSRGERFEAIVPILWLVAGARGQPETARGAGRWFMPRGNPLAVLLKEDSFMEFLVRPCVSG